MRRNILHVGAGSLEYEIREIVGAADEIASLGRELVWENIGDPAAKGDVPPSWIRDIVCELVEEPASWGYCDTQGVPEVRAFLAERVNARGGVQVTPDDIMFFNGLGDAIAKVYGFLRREARVMGPSPAYSTHSSAEAAHSGYPHLTYDLDPDRGWLPDVEDIRNKVRYNDSIAGILLLNPDNPTGAVYPRELLEEIASIAAEHDLFVIVDEVYANIVYDDPPFVPMSEWIGKVPGIAMRGLSKEIPWPGARCGWLEIFNKGRDFVFARYVDSILAAKRLEVSSTTLPQLAIPRIMGDPRYEEHLEERRLEYGRRADELMEEFDGCEHVLVNKPRGALYYTVKFADGLLNGGQSLELDEATAPVVERLVSGVKPDKRFVYHLMGATGIVVVPLSGFQSDHHGFRATLLEPDPETRRETFRTLRRAIDEYVASA